MPPVNQPLAYRQIGADNGQLVVYFHGTPGAPEECAVFDHPAKEHGLTFICQDRFTIDLALQGDAYYRPMAEAIARQAAGGKVDVVGFSIGGFIALQVCRLLGDSVRSLHLVSAAAPPEVDGLINMAAGKFVFRLARSRSTAFRMLSRLHGWTALIAPGLVFRAMFVGAKGEDKSLTTDGRFRDRITGMLQSSLGHHAQGYARDILAYIRPWKETLAQITVDTYLWHGSEDN